MGFGTTRVENPLTDNGRWVFVSSETFLKEVVDKVTSSSKNSNRFKREMGFLRVWPDELNERPHKSGAANRKVC